MHVYDTSRKKGKRKGSNEGGRESKSKNQKIKLTALRCIQLNQARYQVTLAGSTDPVPRLWKDESLGKLTFQK